MGLAIKTVFQVGGDSPKWLHSHVRGSAPTGGTLDVSTFIAADYPKGLLPSGTVVQYNGTSKMFEKIADNGDDDALSVGITDRSLDVADSNAANADAVIDCSILTAAKIREDYLPGGVPSAGVKAAAGMSKFEWISG